MRIYRTAGRAKDMNGKVRFAHCQQDDVILEVYGDDAAYRVEITPESLTKIVGAVFSDMNPHFAPGRDALREIVRDALVKDALKIHDEFQRELLDRLPVGTEH